MHCYKIGFNWKFSVKAVGKHYFIYIKTFRGIYLSLSKSFLAAGYNFWSNWEKGCCLCACNGDTGNCPKPQLPDLLCLTQKKDKHLKEPQSWIFHAPGVAPGIESLCLPHRRCFNLYKKSWIFRRMKYSLNRHGSSSPVVEALGRQPGAAGGWRWASPSQAQCPKHISQGHTYVSLIFPRRKKLWKVFVASNMEQQAPFTCRGLAGQGRLQRSLQTQASPLTSCSTRRSCLLACLHLLSTMLFSFLYFSFLPPFLPFDVSISSDP